MGNTKKDIRMRILKLRDSMNEEQVKEKSKRIWSVVQGFDAFNKSGTIMCYMDFRNEVQTKSIIRYCINKGKTTVVPKVESIDETGSKEIVAYRVGSIGAEMEKGAYGILEPRKNVCDKVCAENIDMVLTPGVAFDRRGARIGFGAGYYDRFFEKTRNDCIKCGLAFSVQILDNISVEEHDIFMDYIITEDGILNINKK